MKFPYHPLTGTTGNEKELRQLLLLKTPGHDCSLNPGCLLVGGAEHSPLSVIQSAGMSTESFRELAGIPEIPANQRMLAAVRLLNTLPLAARADSGAAR